MMATKMAAVHLHAEVTKQRPRRKKASAIKKFFHNAEAAILDDVHKDLMKGRVVSDDLTPLVIVRHANVLWTVTGNERVMDHHGKTQMQRHGLM